MSSRSSSRCKAHRRGNGLQTSQSSKENVYPNYRDRRKPNIRCYLGRLLKRTARELVLLPATMLTIIIQMDSQACPSSSNSPDWRIGWLSRVHVFLCAMLGFICEWEEHIWAGVMPKLPQKKAFNRTIAQAMSYLSKLRITNPISHPPPPLVFLACIFFAWTIAFFRYSHPADQYQDRILAGGAAVGIVVAAVQSDNFLMEAKGYLAWSILLASVVSGASHRILRFCSDRKTKAMSVDKPALFADEHTRTDGN